MALTLTMAACGPSRDQRAARPIPVFSPNGELLSRGGRDGPSCPEALGQWWDRLATEHDGIVDKASFLADAEAQFTDMDLDHDGFITPAELSEYRAGAEEQPPEERLLPPGVTVPANNNAGAYPGGGGRRRGGMSDSPAPIRRSAIPADVVDPVMSADKSLSFKVSHADFMAQADELFAEMDKVHAGRIERAAAIALRCPIAK